MLYEVLECAKYFLGFDKDCWFDADFVKHYKPFILRLIENQEMTKENIFDRSFVNNTLGNSDEFREQEFIRALLDLIRENDTVESLAREAYELYIEKL